MPTKETEEYIINKCHETFYDITTQESVTLKDYEIPESVSFLDTLPRTEAAEKINYELLKKMAFEEYEKEKNSKVRKLEK